MGVIGGHRGYDGPGLGWAPWSCPACAKENTGALAAGCVHCGSGSAQPRHVGQAPPAALSLPAPAAVSDEDRPRWTAADAFAEAWEAAHPDASLAEAFVAGMQFANQRTMQAPPVTADSETLAPAGKARRTIIAALEIFRDQVLRGATDEIASGEWCSVEETEGLIQQLRDEEES